MDIAMGECQYSGKINKELAEQGYITMAGRIPRAYWAKKMFGYELAAN